MTIKVLVVDDSALMRSLLAKVVIRAPDIEVVGTAPDPLVARDMIKDLNPDVITLDIEMPRMNGLEFLSRLMRLRPMPAIVISSLTEHASTASMKALELGAIDVVGKPRADSPEHLAEYSEEICEKIRAAHEARFKLGSQATEQGVRNEGVERQAAPRQLGRAILDRHVVAIGASTGGTEAIRSVLCKLPAEMPPIVMVQHMPEGFTASFARRLDGVSSLHVVEARHGETLRSGNVYLAPGNQHMRVVRSGAGYVVALSQEDKVNRHRPAVDVLFNSVAALAGRNATGILLTGMGKDGADGLLRMRNAGAWTIGQDKESCVVYGMPREAAMIGAIDEEVALPMIAGRLLKRLTALEPRLQPAA